MQSYHQSVMDVSVGIDRFFKQTFTSVTAEGPPLDPQEIQRHPHMIVSTHRSHVDYFLAGHMLIFKGFKNLRFAAGGNLTRLPYIGPRFRGFGAFTVEREMAFERDYVKKLCNGVVSMMENREAVIVFPEGGRSYSGATLEVKTGILGAAVLLQARCPAEDVLLLPMAISYEYPPDVPWFNMLLAGKKLRKRTQPFLKRMLGTVFYFGADILAFAPFMTARSMGRKYGAVYIDYDAPVAVRSLVTMEPNNTSGSSDDFFIYRASMQQLAKTMRRRFLALFRLLPLHLLASIIGREMAITSAQAEKCVPELLASLRTAGRNLKSVEQRTPSEIIELGKQQLLRLKALTQNDGLLSVRKKAVLDYFSAPVLEKSAG
ncbi:MAG: 1-acyl-sn-glycerol-3-phosphate acyltransferase [Chitinispirillaceae bacterium]|jgi:1-acyl-sn-glycerol-3-phosphate acyltransferase